MKSKYIHSLLVLLLLVVVSPSISYAGSSDESAGAGSDSGSKRTFEVKYPAFKIMINNTFMDNSISKYPVLMYEGVTYFPMTWRFTQALGLDVGWDSVEGFSINKSDHPPQKLSNETAIISARNLYAKLPDFDIRVNNQIIDNENEPFPVLVFNDVTYFPMTWRFAVEELGLNISLDNNKFNIYK